MNYRDAIDFLLGRINYERVAALPYGERQLKLDRMRMLLHRLGNPDAGIPIVHVAGTKGKGSTSAQISAILHAAGFRVGVYSSPHLERIEERFCINAEPCTPEELTRLVERLRPVVQDLDAGAKDASSEATFFELTTALALMHFADRQVDAIVLEVGLGGRLDSTNVCQPAVTAITSISLDHTRQLGDTTAKIAAEKAGIIKPGVPLILGAVDAEAHAVITQIARHHGARVVQYGEDYTFEYRAPHEVDEHSAAGELDFVYRNGEQPFELPRASLRMLGQHQAGNAALALATVLELRRQGWRIPTEAMRAGLATAALPGRIEVIGRKPAVVLDVSHNVASAAALVNCLNESFATKDRVLVFAASRDKDVPGMLRELLPHFERVIATEYQENPRAVPIDQLVGWCRQELLRLARPIDGTHLASCTAPDEAWRLAIEWAGVDRLICITGSFFIAGELRPLATAAAVSPTAAV